MKFYKPTVRVKREWCRDLSFRLLLLLVTSNMQRERSKDLPF